MTDRELRNIKSTKRLSKMIERLLEQNVKLKQNQGWIPMSERKPTEEDADRNGDIMAYSSEMNQRTVCKWWYVSGDGVTSHWMPLPKPPKEDQAEKHMKSE